MSGWAGSSGRPPAFVFWQDTIGRPAYIDLCRDTMRRNLAADFELIELDFDSCLRWWPEAEEYFNRCIPRVQGRSPSMETRQVAIFSDLLRVQLLARHGGLWVDADTIVFPRGQALAALVQRDFFCSEGERGTLANGMMGGRADSPFLAAMASGVDDGMAGRTDPVAWGEFGFRLIRRVIEDCADYDFFVVPFGHIQQFSSPASHELGQVVTHAGAFSPGSDYASLVPSDAIAMTMFNNSASSDQRERTREQLLAEDTLLIEAYRRAMSDGPSASCLIETQNRAVFAAQAIERDLRMRKRLRDCNQKVTELRTRITRLRRRLNPERGQQPGALIPADAPDLRLRGVHSRLTERLAERLARAWRW